MLEKLIGKEVQFHGHAAIVVDIEEFPPHKRTIRLDSEEQDLETGKRVRRNYFVQLPYMQFTTLQINKTKMYFLSASNVPLKNAENLVIIPLPNLKEDGRILFSDKQ